MTRLDPSRQLFSPEDLFQLGLDDVVYIKPITVRGQSVYVVHAADGTPLMVAPERELAFAAVRQQDLQPASVH